VRLTFLLAVLLTAHEISAQQSETTAVVSSPDQRTQLRLTVRDAHLGYELLRDGRPLIMWSRLGFVLAGAPPLGDSVRMARTARADRDTTWQQPWGETRRVRDHHRELRVHVEELRTTRRTFTLVVRAFNDGIGLRYEVPSQPNLIDVAIADELTEFAIADNAKAWWIPSHRPAMDRYEFLYASSPVSMLDSVRTPLTIEFTSGPVMVLQEAHLEDYAALDLARVGERTLRAALGAWADGVKVRARTPFVTPWRTIQLADRPADLVPSTLTLNLNPPSLIADTRFIRPMKYNGIWWEMHAGRSTWPTGARHGATTANAIKYIDFAAANGLQATLVEGWNVGWDGDWIGRYGSAFSFMQPTADYDLDAVASHARARNVSLIMHNETAMGIGNYERQLDSAFARYRALGVTAIKTGYVNDRTPEGHAHTGQYMVRHHRRVIETAARYGLTVNAHEPIMDTGERRTWPNMMTREGARGGEYNAGGPDGGNPPEHETILFFTRLLAGPMDYTPGIVDLLLEKATGTARRPDQPRVRTTMAKQLALYVVLYSPMQMAADLPEHYRGHPAWPFIRDVAVDWDTTRVLAGAIGDYVAVARKTRDRDEWFVGAISDEQSRSVRVSLDFLPRGRRYVAEVYRDGAGAHWLTNPTSLAVERRTVTRANALVLRMAPGGGQAIRLRPI
jgi:alpha-glucosidase